MEIFRKGKTAKVTTNSKLVDDSVGVLSYNETNNEIYVIKEDYVGWIEISEFLKTHWNNPDIREYAQKNQDNNLEIKQFLRDKKLNQL